MRSCGFPWLRSDSPTVKRALEQLTVPAAAQRPEARLAGAFFDAAQAARPQPETTRPGAAESQLEPSDVDDAQPSQPEEWLQALSELPPQLETAIRLYVNPCVVVRISHGSYQVISPSRFICEWLKITQYQSLTLIEHIQSVRPNWTIELREVGSNGAAA